MPKAMFAAMPPRRTSRSSTRKDSEILSSWSTTSESVNRPSKVIRWSVAIEPVTAMRTGCSQGRRAGVRATGKDYRSVGVPLASPACLPCGVTVVEPHTELPSETEASSLDDLVSDAAEVTRHLAEVPGPGRAARSRSRTAPSAWSRAWTATATEPRGTRGRPGASERHETGDRPPVAPLAVAALVLSVIGVVWVVLRAVDPPGAGAGSDGGADGAATTLRLAGWSPFATGTPDPRYRLAPGADLPDGTRLGTGPPGAHSPGADDAATALARALRLPGAPVDAGQETAWQDDQRRLSVQPTPGRPWSYTGALGTVSSDGAVTFRRRWVGRPGRATTTDQARATARELARRRRAGRRGRDGRRAGQLGRGAGRPGGRRPAHDRPGHDPGRHG